MPRKIKLTVEDFLFLNEEMKSIGYELRTHLQLSLDMERLDLIAPRPQKGREATYIANANFLNAIAHSSFDMVNEEWRGQDLGWHLIRVRDRKKYVSKPLRRTTNFLYNFIMRARVNKWRIENRPLCRECKKFMEIKEKYKYDEKEGKKKPTGQYYWGCFQNHKHKNGKPVTLGWDKLGKEGKMPKELQDYADEMRSRVAAHKERERKLGIERRSMRQIRKGWKVGNPENLE